VLNPLSRPDAHIMDDADLAGPFVFCFGFALVLLLVSTSKQLLLGCSTVLTSEERIEDRRVNLSSRISTV
jgi:hypothetical protein